MSSYYVLKIQYVNRPPETRNISAPTTTIGRESGDIVLNDPQTSGRHAEILFQGGQVRVRDAGSTNGTWFNGQRLTEFVLEPGQWFQAGQTTLQVMAVHGAQPAAPAKTMMAMGAPPPAAGPGGPAGPGAPQGWAPPGQQAPAPAPAPAPMPAAAPAAGYPGAPPPGQPPAGYPGAPPPGGPMGGPPPGAPPPGGPPMGGPPPGGPMGGPPPGGPMGGPPPGGPMGGPPPGGPMGGPPPGGPMGGPPPGGPMGGPPPGGPPMGGPPPGGPMGGPPPGGPMGGPPMGQPGAAPIAPVPVGGPQGMQPMAPGAAPMAPGPAGAAAFGGGGGVRPNFQGTGGELFVTFLVGMLLTSITIGIYLPWFVCKLARYVMANTTLGPTRRGELRLEFTGTGGDLFVTYLVGMLLTMITLGIYSPWFMCKMIKFFSDNTSAVAPDGTRMRMSFEGTGGDLFVTYLVGMILTQITLGIYMPWFMCKMYKWLFSHTNILENEQPVGSLDFEGTGGELFVTYLLGSFLTMITGGIYLYWFQVKIMKFLAEGTRVNYQGRLFGGAFHGTGGEFFVINLLHGFLTMITLGIYAPWFMVKQWQFQYNNHEFSELGGAGGGMGGPAFQPNMPMR